MSFYIFRAFYFIFFECFVLCFSSVLFYVFRVFCFMFFGFRSILKEIQQQHIRRCSKKNAKKGTSFKMIADSNNQYCKQLLYAGSGKIRRNILQAINNQNRHNCRRKHFPQLLQPVRHFPFSGKNQKRQGTKSERNRRG